MKSTGVVRKVDELGRIVLPIELRKSLDIREKDAIEIYTDTGKIIIQKHYSSCVFCESRDNLVFYKDKKVCTECVEKLKDRI